MKLNLAPQLALPLEIAGQAICVFGIRGSGKTNTAGALAEELLDKGHPIAVIDPTDAWWGLRAGRDGHSEGYPIVIFGGSHEDVPLAEGDGKFIAEFIVREQVPVILSLRHLRKAAQRRFVTEFCEELYHLKGKPEHRTPLTVFIDEAPLFVPQKVMGEVARTVGAVEDLIARGRNAGFGVVLISQRSATINADVRTQADTIICHRMTAALDRKAIEGWFEENASVEDLKAILKSLATLKNGEAWIWAPALGIMQRVQIRLRRTFDSSATPKMGQTVRAPKRLADVDIEKLKSQMATAIEEKKANDPRELKKKIADLEAEREHLTVSIDTVALEKEAENRGYRAAQEEINRTLLDRIAVFMETLDSATDRLRDPVVGGMREAERLRGTALARMPPTVLTKEVTRLPENHQATKNGEISNVSASERKILTALAQSPKGLSMQRLSFLAGYTVNGHFNNMIGALRGRELITPPRVTPIMITPKGETALGGWEALPVGRPLREFWVQKVGGSEGRILRALIESYPNPLTMEELASRAGYTVNGHFNNMVGHLRSIGLMTPPRTPLRASEELF